MDTFGGQTTPRYLCALEAAQLLQLPPEKLEEYRAYGGGPAYQQIEERVIYALVDLVAWVEMRARVSAPPVRQEPGFNSENPPRYLSTLEAASLLRLSPRTLEKHRVYGTGPTYRKLGGRVIYASVDVIAWAETGAKTSTADARKGPAPAHPFRT
jgi:hypothetical protein